MLVELEVTYQILLLLEVQAVEHLYIMEMDQLLEVLVQQVKVMQEVMQLT